MTIQQFSAGQTLTAAQMNALQESDFNYTVNTQSGTSYTLLASDLGKMIKFTNSGSVTLTVPTDASVSFNVGDRIVLMLDSTGTLTVVSASGVTVNSEGSIFELNTRYSIASLIKLATNSWVLTGVMMNTITDGEVTESKIASGAVTSAKIADGTIVNADINAAAAIDIGKIADVTIDTKTANYTLVLTDKNKFIEMNLAGANTVSVPTNASVAFPIGSQIHITQYGAGKTQIVAVTPGTTSVRSTPGTYLRAQYSSATLIKRATDEWYLVGDLSVT